MVGCRIKQAANKANSQRPTAWPPRWRLELGSEGPQKSLRADPNLLDQSFSPEVNKHGYSAVVLLGEISLM